MKKSLLFVVIITIFAFSQNAVAGEKDTKKDTKKVSSMSLYGKFEKKNSGAAGFQSWEINVTVKGTVPEGETMTLFMSYNNDKERQIRTIKSDNMKKGSFNFSKPISKAGQYNLTLKDSKGKVLARRAITAQK